MDMTCVENVALAIRLALETPQASGEVYNITNGEPRAFKDLIEETAEGWAINNIQKSASSSSFSYCQ